MEFLSVQDLTQTYRNKVAVNHINLSIPQGKLVAFLGPNGAGKSTTMRMLTGITKPQAGTITLAGVHPCSRKYRHQIGITFQSSVLDGELTVQQNLRSRMGMYHHLDQAFIQELMQAFNLKSILHQKYKTLSGGQRRRVDITRSLINHPKVLFLDEPSTSLDIQTRDIIWQVLYQLKQKYQLTIILTTHYLEETEKADYVYITNHGNMIAHDTVDNLKQKYAGYVLNMLVDDVDTVKAQIKANYKYKINHQHVTVILPNMQAGLDLIHVLQSHLVDLEYRHGNMNDIFLALTGKEIQ